MRFIPYPSAIDECDTKLHLGSRHAHVSAPSLLLHVVHTGQEHALYFLQFNSVKLQLRYDMLPPLLLEIHEGQSPRGVCATKSGGRMRIARQSFTHPNVLSIVNG